ncbi:MAG: hypothetical protein IJ503_00140 [Akkermansia sp.]|nr:hypothetical protein [Akkermansia sp.]
MSRTLYSRFAGRISITFLMWMVAFAIITSASGVAYAYFKNQQVAIKTEINKLEREIAVCRMSANQYRAKINSQTNRWAMRTRLLADQSTLHTISRHQIEFARSERDMNHASATAAR